MRVKIEQTIRQCKPVISLSFLRPLSLHLHHPPSHLLPRKWPTHHRRSTFALSHSYSPLAIPAPKV